MAFFSLFIAFLLTNKMPRILKKCQIFLIWHQKCQPGNHGRVASVLVRNPFDLPVQVDKGRQLGRVNVADGAAIHVIDQNNEGPYTCAEKKEEYIQQFVQAGKRGKDESPPLVPADLKGRDKKKGGKIRWCIDWRRLNEITKKDTFPMPLSFSSLSSLLRDSVSTIYR